MGKLRTIFTDGSARNNPGPGGFGVIELEGNQIINTYSEQVDNTTNNRMELAAVVYALKVAANNPSDSFIIYSDSAYVVNIVNSWAKIWASNNWTRESGKEIKNLDLVKEIYDLITIPFFNGYVEKCGGHIGIIGNELADALSNNNIKKYQRIIEQNKLVVQCT